MNKARRKAIEKIIDTLTEVYTGLDDIQDDENMAFDSLPQNVQDGDRGNKFLEAVDGLEEAKTDLDGVIKTLKEVIEA
jgi:hypothetical protein